ncbi:MAG: NYN domain-containing protein [Candidatus Nealsonbacteria bacterium]|nr:MAG: NYN domain-containing protein [Candidatus Nealsonbacteria bacterium]
MSEQLEDIRVTYKGFPLSKDSVDVVLASCIYETLFDYKRKIEKIVLLSGDRDFSRVLRRAKKEGIEVWVISGKESCAGLLKGIANKVLYIEDFVQQSPELCLSS